MDLKTSLKYQIKTADGGFK